MRLSSLLPAYAVNINFCEVEPAVNLFLPLLQAPLIKVKPQHQNDFDKKQVPLVFCQNHSDVVVCKRAYKFCQPDSFFCNKNNNQYSHNTSSIFC